MFDLKLGRLSASPSRNTFTDSRGDIVKHRSQVCTRLLTVCIVIYRYVLVLHSSLVETSVQKRIFESLILATIFLLPVLVTSYGVYHRNHYYNYLGRDKSSSEAYLERAPEKRTLIIVRSHAKLKTFILPRIFTIYDSQVSSEDDN